jgi:membrane associated rhomboid family serine protease
MSVMHQNRRNPILLGQDNNALTWLLIINAVIFVTVNFIKIVYYLSYETPMEASQNFNLQILSWFSLPANVQTLIARPWTIITYMFSHEGVWQLIGTLLWLWAFGYILQDLTGNSKLIPVYLYGGFAAGIFFILGSNLIPEYKSLVNSTSPLLGGEAAVFAVAIAATTIAPKYKLFPMINGGIPLWVLTLLFVAIDYTSIANSSAIYAMTHIASGITGFLFGHQLLRGRDWSAWMVNFMNWLNDLFNPEKKYKQKQVIQQGYNKTSRKPYEKTPRITQQKIDEILDKINQQGYPSLTDEERDILKKASQEDL